MDDYADGAAAGLEAALRLEGVGRHSEAMAGYRAALGYADADHDALLDGLARCESALGAGEDSHK